MSSSPLAVIVPTRGRPNNIQKVVNAWDFTNAWDVADLVLVVDADDPEIEGYRAHQRVTRHPDTDEPLIRLVVMDEWMPMVHKLNQVAVDLAQQGRYFALGFAGDDHLPRTINWAKTYLTKLRELGTGMVYGDDGYQGEGLSTEWAVTTDAVRALGRMVPAPVEHMYCDNSIMELFDTAGLLRHLPQVRIEHMHPVAGKGETDAQYRRVNSREQFKKDRDRYDSWRNGQLSADLATLKAIRPGIVNRTVQQKEKRMTRSPFPHHFKQVQGATPEEIGIALADFAMQVPADQAIVELGVFKGRTALQLAWGAHQGNGAHVWGFDAWDLPGNTYDAPFTDPGTRRWARHWVQSLGYANRITLTQAFTHDAAAQWVGPPVGLLFVDADHTEEGARRDIETWTPHLAPDAVIAVDDYGHPDWPGVRQAVDAMVAEGVLAPLQIFHDRLAVTRLAGKDGRENPAASRATTAITSEGVSPSPVAAGKADTYETGRAVTVDLGAAPDEFDNAVSKSGPGESPRSNAVVNHGELEDVVMGTPIEDLTLPQLKSLAKTRGITLGARKDKKADTVQALLDGQ